MSGIMDEKLINQYFQHIKLSMGIIFKDLSIKDDISLHTYIHWFHQIRMRLKQPEYHVYRYEVNFIMETNHKLFQMLDIHNIDSGKFQSNSTQEKIRHIKSYLDELEYHLNKIKGEK